MNTVKNINIQHLSQSERIMLAEKLWDSIAAEQDTLEVTDAQKQLLDQRFVAYQSAPEKGKYWEEVKNEMK